MEGLISPQEASLYWETDARKAVELDPSLSDAHNSLAAFYFFSAWDVPRAESESKRAVELNPNSSEAFHIYSYILTAMNRGPEAIEAQKSGMEADPFARPWALGYTYYRLRQFDAAMNELRLRELANPKNGFLHDILSDTYHAVGMDKEAVEQWVQSYTVRGDKDSGAAVRRAFERGGYHAAAEWRVTALKQAAPKSYTSSFWLACENARAQHKEEALQQLENAYREHSPRMIFLANEPVFDYLHSEPRYQAIMRSMKCQSVPEVWRPPCPISAYFGWLAVSLRGLTCGSGKEQQIPIRILDDEILGAPRLLFQLLVKGDPSGLKLKKEHLCVLRGSDGHRHRQQFLPIADRRLDYWSGDTPEVETRGIATHLCIVSGFAVTEYK